MNFQFETCLGSDVVLVHNRRWSVATLDETRFPGVSCTTFTRVRRKEAILYASRCLYGLDSMQSLLDLLLLYRVSATKAFLHRDWAFVLFHSEKISIQLGNTFMLFVPMQD